MGSILVGEEEKIILSTIYEYVAQYPALKYECIQHPDPKYINIEVCKVYTYQNSIIVDIEYTTMKDIKTISFELNQDNNVIYLGCDVDPQFINDIMYLPGIVNFKFIETYKSKNMSILVNKIQECYRTRITSGYDIYYNFLIKSCDMFSDINDGGIFSNDAMLLSEEFAVRFLRSGPICIIETNKINKYNKNIGFLPLYLIEYFMQGYYLNAIQVQSDIQELLGQSEENISNWQSINS